MTDTVGTILNVAERRIREAGYNGFSFRTVVAEVGVKSASVHYHFPSKDALAEVVARRYNDRIVEAVDQDVKAGADIVQAWRNVFRAALADGARMCLCGALGATSSDLSPGVVADVRRFFDLGLRSLTAGGLTRERATQVLATLEGAMLMASVWGDPTIFDTATGSL